MRAGSRRGDGKVSGPTGQVEHRLEGNEAQARDELTRSLVVAFRDPAEIAGGPRRAHALADRIELERAAQRIR